MQPAKNQTPYMVENQWYSMDFTHKMMQPVSVTAVSGRPAADHLRLETVHLSSPSWSWRKELRRKREARKHQARKENKVKPVKK